MKKKHVYVGALLAVASSLMFSSCLGQFALCQKLVTWNNQIGDKFINELVFFSFCIIPVYPVSLIADTLVLNSIEFWSGTNPVVLTSETKVEGANGTFLVKRDARGYTITSEETKDEVRLDFDPSTQSWSVTADGVTTRFMTFTDANHAEMLLPDGTTTLVELSPAGLMAYRSATAPLMAQNP